VKRQFAPIAALIVIAVVTLSTVGLASAAPTNVQTQHQTSSLQFKSPAYYTINVGKNELWTGLQYDYHDTLGYIEPTVGTHKERSTVDVITTKLTWWKSSDASEVSVAAVGVQVRLAGTITPEQWKTLSQTPVIIRMFVPYNLQTTNGGETRLLVELPSCPGCPPKYSPITSVQNGAKVGLGTVNLRVTLGDLVRETQYGSGEYAGVIQVKLLSYPVSSPTTARGSASGAAAVSDIVLLWPKVASR
jgi:hypothetical protein